MDAHFHEYLAAITGMHDIYGDVGDDHPSDFHQSADVHEAGSATNVGASVATGTASSSL